MGLLNGLSAMGNSLAQYAGAAGLEAQRADLAKQSMVLADQLATTRESAGRQEAGQIAATAAANQQAFQAGQTTITEAGATARTGMTNTTSLGVANIGATTAANQLAAGADLRAAQVRETDAKTSLSNTELAKVNVVTGLQQNLADEYAKPSPDPQIVKTLGDQIGAQGLTSATRGAVLSSLDSLAKTEGANVSMLTRQVSEETDKLGGMMLDPEQRARQQHVVDDLMQQRDASRARQQSFMDQAKSVLPTTSASSSNPAPASATGVTSPAGPIPAPSTGIINSTGGVGPNATPSANESSVATSAVTGAAPTPTPPAPTGAGPAPAVTTAPPTPPSSTATGSTTATPGGATTTQPPKLPGDVGNATNLDVLKAARPDLNIDAMKGRSPALVGIVMQLVDGRATLPPLSSRNPDALTVRAVAAQVDPSLDEASSASRMATRKDFTAGPEARNITALNTALGHAGVVADNFAALNNGSFPLKNWAGNAIESAFGDARQGNTQLAVGALASEARKVFAGASGGGNLTELENWEKNFPVNGSPTQQKGALNQFVNLLDSRLQALGDQYNRGMGVTRDPVTFLEPHALQVMNQLTGNAPNQPVGNQLGTPPARTTPPTTPAPLPMPKTAADAVTGSVYNTTRGAARWDGNQFIPVP